MFTFNGIGLRVLGSHQAGRDGWQVATQWISFVFLPLWPVAAFVARPEGGGWSFAGRTALPPRARTTRRVVAALVLLVAGAITWGAYRAGTRVEVWAYNGFGQPLEVTVGGETRTLLEGAHAEFGGLPAGPLEFAAAAGPGVELERFTRDLSEHGGDTVVYNVAGRGFLRFEYVRYGPGEPPEGFTLGADPVEVLEEDVSYPFEEPPLQREVREGSFVQNTVLAALPSTPLERVLTLASAGERGRALAVAEAELTLAPDSPQLALVTASAVLGDDPDAGCALFERCIERVPDSVDLHRYYQEFWPWGERAELIGRYQELLARNPDSALHHYLVGRILDDDPEGARAHFEAALELDPGFEDAHRALGVDAAWRGEYAAAAEHLARFAAFGPERRAEVLQERVRLAWITGGARAALELLDEDGAEPADPLAAARLAALLQVAADPEALPEALAEFDAAAGRQGVEPGSPHRRYVRGVLALAAGRLQNARNVRDALAGESHLGAMAPALALQLALSDGAVEEDRERAAELIGAEPSGLPGLIGGFDPREQLLALALSRVHGAPEAGPLELALGRGELAEIASLLDDPAAAADLERVDALLTRRPLVLHGAVHHALQWLLQGEEGATAAAARAEHRARARRLSLPGELPYLKSD